MARGSLGSEDLLIERISLELRDLSRVGLSAASDGGRAGTDTPASWSKDYCIVRTTAFLFTCIGVPFCMVVHACMSLCMCTLCSIPDDREVRVSASN